MKHTSSFIENSQKNKFCHHRGPEDLRNRPKNRNVAKNEMMDSLPKLPLIENSRRLQSRLELTLRSTHNYLRSLLNMSIHNHYPFFLLAAIQIWNWEKAFS